jgi:hypothetical protein
LEFKLQLAGITADLAIVLNAVREGMFNMQNAFNLVHSLALRAWYLKHVFAEQYQPEAQASEHCFNVFS